MNAIAAYRGQFIADTVATASPARLLTMLYDRLVRDLDDAESAILLANPQAAHNALRHAQDIVSELSYSLDAGSWPGGEHLDSLYTWLLGQLVTTNLTKDASLLSGCREVVEPLREAWHEAANAQSVAL